ncbi:hypothetical protein FA415_26120, partial [Pseudomonas aeruginosa]|nr:hypothetical protein [Pseudomonas aeruginosa]
EKKPRNKPHRDRCDYNPEPAQPGWKHRSRISETLGHVHRNPQRTRQQQLKQEKLISTPGPTN